MLVGETSRYLLIHACVFYIPSALFLHHGTLPPKHCFVNLFPPKMNWLSFPLGKWLQYLDRTISVCNILSVCLSFLSTFRDQTYTGRDFRDTGCYHSHSPSSSNHTPLHDGIILSLSNGGNSDHLAIKYVTKRHSFCYSVKKWANIKVVFSTTQHIPTVTHVHLRPWSHWRVVPWNDVNCPCIISWWWPSLLQEQPPLSSHSGPAAGVVIRLTASQTCFFYPVLKQTSLRSHQVVTAW